MKWIRIVEINNNSTKFTNRDIEEKFKGDYVEAIKQVKLPEKSWSELEVLGIKRDDITETIDGSPFPLYISYLLPDEINYDSDCDGYDTCWINTLHFAVKNEELYVIFEQYMDSANKIYGEYSPNALATLTHKLIVYKLVK